MNVKQVIVMRDKFPDGKGGIVTPRKGKFIAQGSHASMAWLVDRCKPRRWYQRLWDLFFPFKRFTEAEQEWVDGAFAKICVKCDSEEQLLEIYNQAKAAKLEVHMITDSGRTEFGGVPTRTCLAIGPDLVSKIDPITKSLTLL